MADFYLSEGNLLPVLVEDLYGPDGGLLDLTSASVEIIFVPKNRNRPEVVRTAVIVSLSGRVQYSWQSGDPFYPGTYSYQWRVTYADGRKLDVPNGGGYRTLEVQRRL